MGQRDRPVGLEFYHTLDSLSSQLTDKVEYRLLLGHAYRAVGRLDEAMAQYNEITWLDPSYATAYSRRARIYQTQGRLAEAVGEYQMAVQLRPDSLFYHARLADTYWQGGAF